jgi:REP element-mobilizing transposase RayT
MSYVKIMVHVVWGTKNREPLLTQEKRETLFSHILTNARAKDIFIDSIGGYTDHIHCLISLGCDQSIAKVVQLLKGESSFWANKEGMIRPKLAWSADYFAASVSESAVVKVRDYINRQEEHHKKISFIEEYETFIKSYGFVLAKADEGELSTPSAKAEGYE